MKTLAEEIVSALPRMMEAHANGPRVADIAAFVAAPMPKVREALLEIKAKSLAIVVRYPGSKARHLVPLGHKFAKITTANRHARRVCAHCDTLFQNGSRKFCSKSCFAQHMWLQPERRIKASASGKRAAQLPSRLAVTAKIAARQKTDEARQRQSEINREKWADPAHRAKRSASIQAANGRPENRQYMADVKRKQWEQPGFREQACANMKAVRAEPEVKARYKAAAHKKWANPAYREKMAEHHKDFGKRMGELAKGRKRSPESIERGKETRRRRALERGYWRRPTDKKFEPA